jgi:colanic acid/amylovoran biosynthesis protein
MRILFINAYSAKNRGDFAIVIAMNNYIKKLYPSSTIHIMSSYHEENKSIYTDNNLISVPNIWNIQNKKIFRKYLEGIILFFNACFNIQNKNFKEIHEADLVCSVGGGYLYSSAKGPWGVGLLNMLFHMWLTKKTKIKLICFPQSVGPINYKLDEFILQKVLSKVDLFISRENITTNFLQKKLNLKNIFEYPDIAFFLEGSNSYLHESGQFIGKKIGITVLNWTFADKESNIKTIEEYIQKIIHSLHSISHTHCVKIYIFVQVDVSNGDSDYEISKILHKGLENLSIKSKIIRFTNDMTPSNIIATYGDMDIFIGSRMHSAIFALDARVPTIALAYQPKTLGTFKLLGLEKYVLDIKKFNAAELENLLSPLLNQKSSYSFHQYNIILNNADLDQNLKRIIGN